jgi:CRP-like cAMP-binding protein
METLRSTFNRLRKEIEKSVPLTDSEFAQATSYFSPRKLRKGQFLLQQGELCKYLAFVSAGLLRSYKIDAKGEEHIDEFALEGWWISDLYSFLTGKPSTYFIDALEDSDLLLIEAEAYNTLCSEIPRFEHYVRILLQNNLIATHSRIIDTNSLPAEERYLRLTDRCPDITGRIAQRHVASFLGITPEALSRIRNRLSKKPVSTS